VSATTVKLLQAASEIVGGDEALANHLGISERLLSRFMADRRELPDQLLLRAVDIVFADVPLTNQLALQSQDYRRER
jgi:DNA-binding transcriptional regulator YdaS (Cro superfamily)